MRGRRPSLFAALCAVAGAVLVAFVLLPAASMVVGAGAGLLGDALRQDDVRRSLWPVSYTHLTLPTNREV